MMARVCYFGEDAESPKDPHYLIVKAPTFSELSAAVNDMITRKRYQVAGGVAVTHDGDCLQALVKQHSE